MTDDEVRRLADDTLRKALAQPGYEKIDVRSGFDSDGDPALFVDVWLAPETPIVDASVYADAIVALRASLARRGESRFPYLLMIHPDDDEPLDDDWRGREPLDALQQ
jgi:hypothetical protein